MVSCGTQSSTGNDKSIPADSAQTQPPANTVTLAGRHYRTVTIGAQKWTAENLNDSGVSGSAGKCHFDNVDSCGKYGRLYSWAEALALPDSCNTKSCKDQIKSEHQGLCPTGWHVPSDWDWTILTEGIGDSISGAKLKSKSGWSQSGNGSDDYGFAVLAAGIMNSAGSYDRLGAASAFWATTESGNSTSTFRWFLPDYDGVVTYYGNVTRSYRFSLRCLKNK